MKYELEQTPEFKNWLTGRKVKPFKGRLLARFERIRNGNFGDYKKISNEIFELRFFFGSGFRVYYTIKNDCVVLLLVGGDKSSQTNDIEKAKQLLIEME